VKRIIIRPTISADLKHLTTEDLPHRIRAITALDGETVLAIGGIGYRGDGTVIAFMQANSDFRKYPAAIHRAGVMGMKLIRESGVPVVIAEAEAGNAAAEPWLLHFGFRAVEFAGRRAFVWERR
jgi:hypothetical protein